MIHTAQFYNTLTPNNTKQFVDKYGDNPSIAADKINATWNRQGISVVNINHANSFTRVYFVIDVIKALGTADITPSHILNINSVIASFVRDVSCGKDNHCTLIRLDLRYDAVVSSTDRQLLLSLLGQKSKETHGFKKKYNLYDTSVYYNSKAIQVKIYDKEAERNSKHERPQEFEENVLRLEIVLMNSHLNYNYRKYSIDKSLESYLHDDIHKKYLLNHPLKFIYSGDFYKITEARKLINSSDLKPRNKHQLIDFLINISRNGVESTKHTLSNYQYRKFVMQLELLNINPILIAKNRKGAPSHLVNPFSCYLR